MSHSASDKAPVLRLREALQPSDALSCEEARDRLPALVEAEMGGADVDNDPVFAELLQHLDGCVECATFYAGLADDFALLIDPSEPLPAVRPAMPTFFAPARSSENVVLHVLGGVLRRFQLALRVPTLNTATATLSGTSLFFSELPEVTGKPLVSVVLRPQGDLAELHVAIREAEGNQQWRVRLTAPSYEQTATTNEQGIAQFSGLLMANLSELTLECQELRSDDDDFIM